MMDLTKLSIACKAMRAKRLCIEINNDWKQLNVSKNKLSSVLIMTLRPDFLYSLVYDNFFQRSNVGGRNKNKMSQNKDIT